MADTQENQQWGAVYHADPTTETALRTLVGLVNTSELATIFAAVKAKSMQVHVDSGFVLITNVDPAKTAEVAYATQQR